ncbi:protein NRT1/ PTR FAMILY 7.3-like [Prosopis cineraria]|uniref:protein NRT1/ PTR FAMILY 7.3-like n=1 Tax=Prosopis cineraria TaxID=364024 RepID=UPI00241082E5|nr:protein NRT1/ PTR FAMILY 7.3-like [Prosopis cineraria]
MGQDNANAANNVSEWAGTVYMCSLVGAFLSDSYWGRYKTCVVFQAILVLGLGLLSLTSSRFLLKPSGCGDEHFTCGSHLPYQKALFYTSIYLIALGYGGYQPNIATFGADQFDEADPEEGHSKKAFFSYFYFALNIGSLFSDTVLGYFESEAMWTLGFWTSTGSASLALILFLCGTTRYRYFKPGGNPIPRFCQVIVAATRKWKVKGISGDDNLFEVEEYSNRGRKIVHTEGLRYVDLVILIIQVEEVKCILRLIPIWLCTMLYSVVYTQMSSLSVEQGASMDTRISSFKIPPASVAIFNIISASAFIFFYERVLT